MPDPSQTPQPRPAPREYLLTVRREGEGLTAHWDQGNPFPLPLDKRDLADILSRLQVPLVLLEACRGAQVSDRPVFGALAPALLQGGVGSVIAFSRRRRDPGLRAALPGPGGGPHHRRVTGRGARRAPDQPRPLAGPRPGPGDRRSARLNHPPTLPRRRRPCAGPPRRTGHRERRTPVRRVPARRHRTPRFPARPQVPLPRPRPRAIGNEKGAPLQLQRATARRRRGGQDGARPRGRSLVAAHRPLRSSAFPQLREGRRGRGRGPAARRVPGHRRLRRAGTGRAVGPGSAALPSQPGAPGLGQLRVYAPRLRAPGWTSPGRVRRAHRPRQGCARRTRRDRWRGPRRPGAALPRADRRRHGTQARRPAAGDLPLPGDRARRHPGTAPARARLAGRAAPAARHRRAQRD